MCPLVYASLSVKSFLYFFFVLFPNGFLFHIFFYHIRLNLFVVKGSACLILRLGREGQQHKKKTQSMMMPDSHLVNGHTKKFVCFFLIHEHKNKIKRKNENVFSVLCVFVCLVFFFYIHRLRFSMLIQHFFVFHALQEKASL